MMSSRRDLLKAGAGTLCALSAWGGWKRSAHGAESKGDANPMTPLDYGRSFICHTAPANSVRFWVESRTRIIDEERGGHTDYYQCGACKSENTFAEKDLLHEDNYDFTPIFGAGNILIFRRKSYLNEDYRTITASEEILWGPPSLRLRDGSNVTELTGWEGIREATAEAVPIVSQTELWNEDTGLRAIIECPVKTMNISVDERMYQVDTGPVGYPDLSKRYEPQIDCLRLAFVVFNAPDFADFVVEQPTPAVQEGSEPKIYHYSNPFSMAAKNRLFAVE